MSARRDEFQIMGFMKFYLALHILLPLALIGMMIWVANEPNLKLKDEAPLVIGVLALWAIYDIYRLCKWGGFSVTITDEEITVGKERVAWSDVEGASVTTAFKFGTWIEIRPRGGEALAIPAAICQKDLLLTLVEKHHPALVKK